MGHIEQFLALAQDGGVTLDGIKPVEVAGRGIGIVATRNLEVLLSVPLVLLLPFLRPTDAVGQRGDVILDIPSPSVRSIGSVAKGVLNRLPSTLPFHGILAADLALDATTEFATWKKLLPSREHLAATMPLMWPPGLQELLPGGARELLNKQQAKFQTQWEAVATVFPAVSEEEYRYYWLIVNTRTFYFESPGLEKYSWDDRLALLPVADLFNHGEDGCQVAYGEDGYTVTADRAYAEGSEVFLSYGRHSNDWLLVEYGFLLAPNRWDAISLDELLMPRLSRSQAKELARTCVSGPCALSAEDGLSSQTQVALRMLAYARADWLRYVHDAKKTLKREPQVRALMETLRRHLQQRARKRLSRIAKSSLGDQNQRNVLRQRWQQIQSITESDWVVYTES